MPRLTPDSILQRSIPDAISDRLGLIGAYRGDGEWADAARDDIRAMKALQGRKIAAMDEAARAAAFKVLCCAESWHESLADAQGSAGHAARRTAMRIRSTRLALFGKSALEAMVERSVAIDIRDAPARVAALAAAVQPEAIR